MTEQQKQRPVPHQAGPVRRPAQPAGQGTPVRRPAPGMRPATTAQGAPIRRPAPGMRPATTAQGAPVRRPAPGMRPAQGAPIRRSVQTRPLQTPVNPAQSQPQQSKPAPQTTGSELSLNPKSLAFVAVIVFLCGILMGAMMFGGSSKPQVVGLTGVVKNADIRTRTPRCGQIDKGQACILYVMNNTRYDKIAENFFDTALRLTEVPIFSISMANPKYAKKRIPPGAFAEILIPKVR